jgi:hypothetical protein
MDLLKRAQMFLMMSIGMIDFQKKRERNEGDFLYYLDDKIVIRVNRFISVSIQWRCLCGNMLNV